MNVKISSKHKFLAGFWWNNQLFFNHYMLDIDMTTATADIIDQNIAFLRLRYMIEDVFEDIVFIEQNEHDAIDQLESVGLKLAILPIDPVDQIVGMMLQCKFEAVLEGKILIRSVKLSSVRGDDIVYESDHTEYNALAGQSGWWNMLDPDDTTTIEDVAVSRQLNSRKRWREMSMEWSEESTADVDESENVLVFKDKPRDEN